MKTTRGFLILLATILAWLAYSCFRVTAPAPDGGPLVVIDAGPDAPVCRALVARGSSTADRRSVQALRVVPRIVGGQASKPGAWPFVVALETTSGFQYCGGTLIKPSWVLTAGHCEVRVGELAVIGRSNLRAKDGEVILIDEVRTHERYQPSAGPEKGYDVALLHLSKPSVAKVSGLPPKNGGFSGNAVGIGYGATSEGGQTSPILREVSLPILTDTECLLAYPGAPVTAFCAGYTHDGGKDTCQGDSGGGLFIGGFILGITSYGEGCAREGYPGVYTAVPLVIDFVESCST